MSAETEQILTEFRSNSGERRGDNGLMESLEGEWEEDSDNKSNSISSCRQLFLTTYLTPALRVSCYEYADGATWLGGSIYITKSLIRRCLLYLLFALSILVFVGTMVRSISALGAAPKEAHDAVAMEVRAQASQQSELRTRRYSVKS